MPGKSIVLPKHKNSDPRALLAEGAAFRIEAMQHSNGRYEAKEFLDGLSEARLTKMQARLDEIAEYGIPSNTVKYNPVDDGLAEIKTHGERLFVFRDGSKLIVATHGMDKGTKKVQNREIKRAKRLMREYKERST